MAPSYRSRLRAVQSRPSCATRSDGDCVVRGACLAGVEGAAVESLGSASLLLRYRLEIDCANERFSAVECSVSATRPRPCENTGSQFGVYSSRSGWCRRGRRVRVRSRRPRGPTARRSSPRPGARPRGRTTAVPTVKTNTTANRPTRTAVSATGIRAIRPGVSTTSVSPSHRRRMRWACRALRQPALYTLEPPGRGTSTASQRHRPR